MRKIFSFIEQSYPFDWRTPYGYFVAWMAQCVGGESTATIYVQFLNLVFGSCWLFVFIAEDITKDVFAFNIIAKAKTTSNENHTELTKCFRDMVQIYSEAKQ